MYGITVQNLTTGSKAVRAERAIRTIRTKLSTILDMKEPGKNESAAERLRRQRRWIDDIQHVIDHHNALPAEDSQFRRDEIDKDNFLEFLDSRTGGEDYTLTQNTRGLNSKDLLSSAAIDLAFKFKVGDKVIAAYKGKEAGTLFKKASVRGSWDPRPATVREAMLRPMKQGTELTQGENGRKTRV